MEGRMGEVVANPAWRLLVEGIGKKLGRYYKGGFGGPSSYECECFDEENKVVG